MGSGKKERSYLSLKDRNQPQVMMMKPKLNRSDQDSGDGHTTLTKDTDVGQDMAKKLSQDSTDDHTTLNLDRIIKTNARIRMRIETRDEKM